MREKFMIKIAHRGVSAQAPENTRAAFEKMLPLDIIWLETDIDITSDGQLVLIHDAGVNRTSNGNGKVNRNTLQGLQKLDFGEWFSPVYQGQQIVTLDWLIDFVNLHQLNVNFELKTDVQGEQQNFYLMRIHKAFLRLNPNCQIIVSSFNVPLLKKFHALMPKVDTGLLVDGPITDSHLEQAQAVGAGYIHPDVSFLTQEQARILMNKDFKLNVWTVNDPKTMARLNEWGINAAFTDFPAGVTV
ncbi:glycerophosphodiester phosphodiesterase family protein [Leuconostoc citreum]|uniref:glycerophosphodiester phosphodiesterase family protein n=1 Tax=Leuconostoc citreum TaxID=33964 RepID=UPI000C292CAD